MLTFLLFVILLLAVVNIHELGHMLIAKLFHVYCHEFSFGMGPKIFSFKGKETQYSIRALPLGGYVAMAGEGDEELRKENDVEVPFERTLQGVANWKKLLIFSGGIFMNIILAVTIVAMVFLHYGAVSLSPDSTINEVAEGYPAELAGLKAGDIIKKIELPDGEIFNCENFGDVSSYLSLYEGEGSIQFTIERESEEKVYELTPVYSQDEGRYLIGISSKGYETKEVNIFNCWTISIDYCIDNVRTIVSTIANLFRGKGFNNVSGVVGMYETTGQVVEMGLDYYFLLVAVISLNLGIMNALPIAMLDGGKILILLIEMAIGKPLNKKLVEVIMTASVIFLLGLTFVITIKDIIQLF